MIFAIGLVLTMFAIIGSRAWGNPNPFVIDWRDHLFGWPFILGLVLIIISICKLAVRYLP